MFQFDNNALRRIFITMVVILCPSFIVYGNKLANPLSVFLCYGIGLVLGCFLVAVVIQKCQDSWRKKDASDSR